MTEGGRRWNSVMNNFASGEEKSTVGMMPITPFIIADLMDKGVAVGIFIQMVSIEAKLDART